MLLSPDMCNCWVAYFEPGDPDVYGNRRQSNVVQFYRANWKDTEAENVTINQREYTISHTVYLANPVVAGGYLKRLTDSVNSVLSVVESSNAGIQCPTDGLIINVGYQNDLDDVSDKVYMAQL